MAGTFLFGDPFRRFWSSPVNYFQIQGLNPPMDWFESSTSHCFKINIPGYGPSNVKVEVDEDNVLHIRGELGAKEKEREEFPAGKREGSAVLWHWHAAERVVPAGGFHRAVELPENVKVDQIKAQVENGVLTILVPKEVTPPKPPSKARTIHVTSKL